MAAKKQSAPVVEDIALDEPMDELGMDAPAGANFDAAQASIPTASKNEGQNALGGLILSEDEDDDSFFGGLQKEPSPSRWVVAKYLGATGNPNGFHAQSINGVKAIFPLKKLRITPFSFLLGARKSGFVDFTPNPGGKVMKRVDNQPNFHVQDCVPDEFQSPDKIMEWVDQIEEESGKRLEFAINQF